VRREAVEIFTIGHSTRPAEVFLALLRAHEIRQLADIRTIPKSRRHPQYNAAALEEFLARHAIRYCHFPSLGGLRKPRSDSINTAWRHASFRGYADHMQTDDFRRGLEDLLGFAQSGRTVVMCAEAVWWQCHRQLLADALLAQDVPVRHILEIAEAKPHRLSDFAKVSGRTVTYPGLV
jgi:uncharacterized protein (DUF488 family)